MAKGGVKEYLECEAMLHEIFENTGFCRNSCRNINSFNFKSYCTNCFEFYYLMSDSTDLREACKKLVDERVKIYGLPVKQGNRCGYLTDTGCKTKSHKSPFCISFVCNDLMKELEEKYFIVYDDFLVSTQLENILLKKASSDEINSFKSVLKDWIIKSKGPTGI